MPIAGRGSVDHDTLSGVSANDHHVKTVASEIALADLSERAHGSLTGATADVHHTGAHTPESHTGQGATAAELETLTDLSDADALHIHTPNKEVFLYAVAQATNFPYPTRVSGRSIVTVNAGANAQFTWHVPADFNSLVSADVICVPDTTETIQFDSLGQWGKDGETVNNETDTDLNKTLAVTVNLQATLDMSGGMTLLEALDIMTLVFESDTTQIRVSHLRIVYT